MSPAGRRGRLSRRSAAGACAALLALTLAGCVDDPAVPEGALPTPTEEASGHVSESASPSDVPSATGSPQIALQNIHVGGGAQGRREGVMLCGGRILAAPPAAGIANDAFAVFDPVSGAGEITHVELPQGSDLQPNARWLLVAHCADSTQGPVVSFAYQEMPLPDTGGVGVRGAYTLDGQLLWVREDLNVKAELKAGLLVLGNAPDQADLLVDVATGKTLRTFTSPLSTRLVMTHDRLIEREPGEAPMLTDLEGRKVKKLTYAGTFYSDDNVIFAVDVRQVIAIDARTGNRLWSAGLQLDPLSVPQVEPLTGVAVMVDQQYAVHGFDLNTGRQLWQVPTEVENPRLTVAGGIVLLDRRDQGYQLLLDSQTGKQLPEPATTVLDITNQGALMIIDDVARLVPLPSLRVVPPTPTSS